MNRKDAGSIVWDMIIENEIPISDSLKNAMAVLEATESSTPVVQVGLLVSCNSVIRSTHELLALNSPEAQILYTDSALAGEVYAVLLDIEKAITE